MRAAGAGARRGCGGRGRDCAVRWPLRHDILRTGPAHGRRGGAAAACPRPTAAAESAARRRWTRQGRRDLLDRQLPGAAGHRLAATCEAPSSAPQPPPLPPRRPPERALGASAAPRAGPSGRGAGSAAHGAPGARLSRRPHPRRQRHRGIPGPPGTPAPRGP
ncbi:putative cuticle collagen 80 [Chamaea fasciata]|uniref:putative cuticle collagen 80 n=1 Tax=Chamaea fasciata TaxID=190680 RepID=UPI00336A87E3